MSMVVYLLPVRTHQTIKRSPYFATVISYFVTYTSLATFGTSLFRFRRSLLAFGASLFLTGRSHSRGASLHFRKIGTLCRMHQRLSSMHMSRTGVQLRTLQNRSWLAIRLTWGEPEFSPLTLPSPPSEWGRGF